mmetsp:Transcript_15975/g.24469  ORF Transcript_15975/g.24469 Transcript_15975/m.24469 type:complete len:80 (-) Transcript_15975:88-327(-)
MNSFVKERWSKRKLSSRGRTRDKMFSMLDGTRYNQNKLTKPFISPPPESLDAQTFKEDDRSFIIVSNSKTAISSVRTFC